MHKHNFFALAICLIPVNIYAVVTDTNGITDGNTMLSTQTVSIDTTPVVIDTTPINHKQPVKVIETNIQDLSLEKNTIIGTDNKVHKLAKDVIIESKRRALLDRSMLSTGAKIKLELYSDEKIHKIILEDPIPTNLQN